MSILPYIPLNTLQEAEALITEIKAVFPDYTSEIFPYMGMFVILSPKDKNREWRSAMPEDLVIPSDMTIPYVEPARDTDSNIYLHDNILNS